MNSSESTNQKSGERLDLQTSQEHAFRLPEEEKAHVLEFDDAHFHDGSAILLPNPNPENESNSGGKDQITGVDLLVACYRYAEKNEGQSMLIAGHATDNESSSRSRRRVAGTLWYEETLAWGRAENVRALLKGDRNGWVKTAEKHNTVEDIQKILKWIATLGVDCDPGSVDGRLGAKTREGIRGFQAYHDDMTGRSIGVDGKMGAETWKAIFDVYREALKNGLETDEEGLKDYQRLLHLVDPRADAVGCGTAHPIPSDWASDYRSQTNRRVEAFFFPRETDEPDVDVSAQDPETPPQSEIFSYVFAPIPTSPAAPIVDEAEVDIVEVEGMYKPGYTDPNDNLTDVHAKRSGYKEGYKSEEDDGRIFINHRPITSVNNWKNKPEAWQEAWDADTQYIELTAKISTPDVLPADARVVWEWEDPDDPTNDTIELDVTGQIEDRSLIPVREEAGQYLDPSDYSFEKKRNGEWETVQEEIADDNRGQCDYPGSGSGEEATFEEVSPYTMKEVGDRKCETAVEKKESTVRLHCTNVGGDNFKVRVRLKSHPFKDKGSDQTGRMTMWKRIDVEYRRMQGAETLPVEEVAPYFEPAFVQIDFTDELEAKPKMDFMVKEYSDFSDKSSDYVKAPSKGGVFENEYEPGWFLLVSAHEAVQKMGGGSADRLYDSRFHTTAGNGQVEIEVPPSHSGDLSGHNVYRMTSSFRDVSTATRVNNSTVPPDATFTDTGVTNGTTYFYRVTNIDENGTETLGSHELKAMPQDPSPSSSSKERPYFKTYDYGGSDRWEAIVIPEDIEEEVFSVRLFEGENSVRVRVWKKYRATPTPGETTLFLRDIDRQPDFEPGNGLVGDDGEGGAYHRSIEYYPRHKLIRPANHWISGGLGFSKKVDAAVVTPGNLAVGGVSPANTDGGREYFAGRTILFTKHHGYQELDGDDQKKKFLGTIVHELTHAFGFPHKCGYYTFDDPAEKSCSMNYYNTWVYEVEDGRKYEVQPDDDDLQQIAIDNGLNSWRNIYHHPRNDKYRELRGLKDPEIGDTFWLPDSRSVLRFNIDQNGDEIDEGIHLCAQHVDGIRRVHLEDNPALWQT